MRYSPPSCDHDGMVAFAEHEQRFIPELTPTVQRNLARLQTLTSRFEEAQKALEGDDLGSGSQFIGWLLSIEHHVHKFAETQAAAVKEFDRYLRNIKYQWDVEFRILLLMTYLDPSIQFQTGRTCSDPEFHGMRMFLAELIAEQIAIEMSGTQDVSDHGEPGSDDFSTYVQSASGQRPIVQPQAQIELYHQIRDSCKHSKDFWDRAPPELSQLSVVAHRISGILTTSASVERAFSRARAVCTDYQLAQKQETVSSRVVICANWAIAEPLLREVLALPSRQRANVGNELEREPVPWRLEVYPTAE
jgi:hypothetical protein